MKKKFIVLLIALNLIHIPMTFAAAMWDQPKTKVQAHQLVFIRIRDEYQLRYAIRGLPEGTHQVRANFWSASGTYYDVTFDNPTGVAYLTCNGTYIFEMLDASGRTIAETRQVITKKISDPACRSYENEGLKNDFAGSFKDNPDGSKQVTWAADPNIAVIHVYKDGEFIKEYNASNKHEIERDGTHVADFSDPGLYSLIGFDALRRYLGSIDFVVGDGGKAGLVDDDNDDGNDGGCNGCTWLEQALNCPAWDDYMEGWKDMLKDVYQPPDWQQVANIMRDTIVPAMAQEIVNRSPEMAKIFADEFTSREKKVEPAPTRPPDYEVQIPLPQIQDLSEEIDFDLNNNVPSFEPDYSESEPFIIPNPLDLQFDDKDLGYELQNIDLDDKTYNMPQIDDENEMPQYNVPKESGDIPQYDIPQNNDMPNYNVPSEDIRYYEGGG